MNEVELQLLGQKCETLHYSQRRRFIVIPFETRSVLRASSCKAKSAIESYIYTYMYITSNFLLKDSEVRTGGTQEKLSYIR